jgi:hypothetical protein
MISEQLSDSDYARAFDAIAAAFQAHVECDEDLTAELRAEAVQIARCATIDVLGRDVAQINSAMPFRADGAWTCGFAQSLEGGLGGFMAEYELAVAYVTAEEA